MTILGMASLPAKRHPQRNEDTGFAEHLNNGVCIGGVFDGMGGHMAGDQASRIASGVVYQVLREIRGDEPATQVVGILSQAMKDAAVEIGRQLSGTDAGTTAAVAIAMPEKEKSYRITAIGAGDARAYLQKNRTLELLTVDNLLPDQGTGILVMDYKEAQRRLARGNLLRLGSVEREEEMDAATEIQFLRRNFVVNPLSVQGQYEPVITTGVAPAGSLIVLTSDGVHDNLTDREIAKITGGSFGPQVLARMLVESARKRADDEKHLRHKDDDMTAFVMRLI